MAGVFRFFPSLSANLLFLETLSLFPGCLCGIPLGFTWETEAFTKCQSDSKPGPLELSWQQMNLLSSGLPALCLSLGSLGSYTYVQCQPVVHVKAVCSFQLLTQSGSKSPAHQQQQRPRRSVPSPVLCLLRPASLWASCWRSG